MKAENDSRSYGGIKFKPVEVAINLGFIGCTKWLPPLAENVAYLWNEYWRIVRDPARQAMRVYDSKDRIALFVNQVVPDEDWGDIDMEDEEEE